jgi:hypothetical protein
MDLRATSLQNERVLKKPKSNGPIIAVEVPLTWLECHQDSQGVDDGQGLFLETANV